MTVINGFISVLKKIFKGKRKPRKRKKRTAARKTKRKKTTANKKRTKANSKKKVKEKAPLKSSKKSPVKKKKKPTAKIKKKVKKAKKTPKPKKKSIPPLKKKKAATKEKPKEAAPGVLVGNVTHYFSRIEVIVLKVTRETVRVGDEIMIVGRDSKFSQKIDSLQIESVDVKSARKGQLVGLKVKKKAKEGDLVFKV